MTVRAFVVHWEPTELDLKLEAARQAGADVLGGEALDARRAQEEIRRLQPDVLICWLTWKPNHTRMLVGALRATDWGHRLPVLFIDADPEPTPVATLAQLRTTIPDALVDVPGRLAFWIERLEAMASRKDAARHPAP